MSVDATRSLISVTRCESSSRTSETSARPGLADGRRVDLAGGGAQREDADAERREREPFALVALAAAAKLGEDLGIGDLEP